MVDNNAYFIERNALISEFADKINRVSSGKYTYQNYKDKYSELISGKISDYEIWESFLKQYLSNTIKDACLYLISEIEKNKNLAENLIEDNNKLKEIIKKIEVNNLRYEDLAKLKVEVEQLGSNIFERIYFGLNKKTWKWIERIITYLLGIITACILNFIFKA